MILQALKEYYDRKVADQGSGIAPYGLEPKPVHFRVVYSADGALVDVQDLREPDGKWLRPAMLLLPHSVKRTSGTRANILWDNAKYALGVRPRDRKTGKLAPEEAVQECRSAFRAAAAETLRGLEHIPSVSGFLAFQSSVTEVMLQTSETFQTLQDEGPNVVFRLAGSDADLTDLPEVRDAAIRAYDAEKSEQAVCLVTGHLAPIERTHTSVSNVAGGLPGGKDIVAFNFRASESYGNTELQGLNAPVSKFAAFAYTTALNHLLRRESRQRLVLADTTAAFWSERPSILETGLVDVFGEPFKDDPDRGAQAVADLYRSVQNGAWIADQASNRFYALGLAPNAKRLSVRFWHVDTVSGLASKLKRHFDDLEIIRAPHDPPALSLQRLLRTTAVLGKTENIPPNLAGDTVRAILEGRPYPATLLSAAIRRARAEQASDRRNLPYERAALIKACLNRTEKEELTVSLDTTNTNIGYRLGRLFAVLERLQEEASPGINATIRDRYYNAASGTPVSVYPILMRLKNHHLAKLENVGRRVNLERLIGQIVEGFSDFPATLTLSDQGRFAIGYYHQQQDFFVKKQPTDNKE